jgi:hypothetical protein
MLKPAVDHGQQSVRLGACITSLHSAQSHRRPSDAAGLAGSVTDGPPGATARDLLLNLPAVGDLLQALVDRHATPPATRCSITVRYRGLAVCLLSSDAEAAAMTERQLGSGRGAVPEALAAGSTVLTTDAGEAGTVTTTMAVPLAVGAGTGGVFAAYGQLVGGFTAAEQVLIRQVADQAAGALQVLARMADTLDLAGAAVDALTDRSTIDTAVGLLMARHQLTGAQAWAELCRVAARDGVEVEAAARVIVAG